MMINSIIMQKCPTWMVVQEMFVFQTESDFLLDDESREAYSALGPEAFESTLGGTGLDSRRSLLGSHRPFTQAAFGPQALGIRNPDSRSSGPALSWLIVRRGLVLFVHLIC